MKVETLTYTLSGRWSSPLPDLDSPQTLVMIFASPIYINNPEPIQELKRKYPNSKIVGCSSAGVVSGPCILDDSLSVAITKFEKTQIKTVSKSISGPEESYQAGVDIVNKLNAPDLRCLFVLSDGLNINGSELANGLNHTIDKKIIISGGLAADGKDFKKTWTICDGQLELNQILAVGFYGKDLQIGHGSRGGWDVFGPERFVTRSKNNILFELDGQPALTLYKDYLGDMAKGLPATGLLFPLAIWPKNTPDSRLVRTILGIDESTHSLIFAGDIPEGYCTQLMRSKFDDLIASAADAGASALTCLLEDNQSLENPILSIAISCVGRRLLLGERTEEETESILEHLPSHTHQVGFYSYGELSPQGIRNCELHNQTMTLTTLYEK